MRSPWHLFCTVRPPFGPLLATGIPYDEGKRVNPMRHSNCTAPEAGNNPTGTMPDTPLVVHWFPDQFSMHIRKPHPAVPIDSHGDTDPNDTTGPAAPTGLRTTAKTDSSLSPARTAAAENAGVTGYDVHRGGTADNLSPFIGTGGAPAVHASCDRAAVGCAHVVPRVVPLSAAFADAPLEDGFKSSVATGKGTGDLQLRTGKSDWSAFDEDGDYSRNTVPSPAGASRLPLYVGSHLAWSTPPA